MPEIFPFRGVHYDPEKVADLTKVMTQPYDRIDDALQEEYYGRHPHNFIRIDKRKEEPGDATGARKYEAAAGEFEAWLSQGILVRDPDPCLYAYHQVYRAPDGKRKVRKGLTAMVKMEEPGKGKIHPHEETHSGPKVDRRRLLDATRAHLSQVFLLYSDPEKAVNRILDFRTRGAPDLEATDDFGELHRVWSIEGGKIIGQLQKELARKNAIIADGHHRYETAWGYCLDQRTSGSRVGEPESSENVLATLVNIDDEGLTIFGTQRLIRGLPDFDFDAVLKGASRMFDLRTYPQADRKRMLEDLRIEGLKRPAFGAAAQGKDCLYLFIVKNAKRAADQVKGKKSEEWRSLDVNLLHTLVLEGILGITPEDTRQERHVDYLRSADEAIDLALQGKRQCAFLVNPVKISQIKKIVQKGERFPQKTTDFYPKLLSGLVMCKLNYAGA